MSMRFRVCDRTNVVVEPQVKSQWFVKMDNLSKSSCRCHVDEGRYKILTKQLIL